MHEAELYALRVSIADAVVRFCLVSGGKLLVTDEELRLIVQQRIPNWSSLIRVLTSVPAQIPVVEVDLVSTEGRWFVETRVFDETDAPRPQLACTLYQMMRKEAEKQGIILEEMVCSACRH